MPPGAFPMSRQPKRSYRLGSVYRWRLIKFEALGATFRLLIAYRPDVEEYRSLLGMDVGEDSRVLAEYCYHGTHPGWHTHAACGDVRESPIGVMRWPEMRRRPRGRARHRRVEYVRSGKLMNDAHALDIAVTRFNLYGRGDDLFSRRTGGVP
jgi:hypothetical protein